MNWHKFETPVLCYTPNDYNKGFWSSGYLNTINAQQAWDHHKGSPNTVIGVTDTQFDPNNPDLAGKFVQVTAITNAQFRNHGSRVAGLIAGNTDNDTGFASIGFNCRLHGESYSNGDQGNYDLSIANNRRIINASWIYSFYNANYEDLYNEMYENGTFMVAAAGNGYHGNQGASSAYKYPASYDQVFSVTGCNWIPNNPDAEVGGHSAIRGDSVQTQQHNDRVDLMAPSFHVGGLITEDTTVSGRDRWFRESGDGTSYAAPLVAGTAGLMVDAKPCLTPYQVEYILKTTAKADVLQFPENQLYVGRIGAGLLDAGEALKNTVHYPHPDSIIACNDAATQTLYIKGIEFTSMCAPRYATNGHKPQLSVAIENGTPPYTYRWEALPSNTTTLDDYTSATPVILSSTPPPFGGMNHMVNYRLTVYDNSSIPKTAKRFFYLPLRTDSSASWGWDLAMRDSYMDVCDEPNLQYTRNTRDWQIWESPDLWARQTPDGQTTPQTPEWISGMPNAAYVRIRNIGCAAFDSAATPSFVHLYWTKASTGERWEQDWNGTTLVPTSTGGVTRGGDQIGSAGIPSLAPGQSIILGQDWQPTQPQIFAPVHPNDPAPEAVDICLLARIESEPFYPFGMSILETLNGNVKTNVNNNNNIVTRNLIVQNKVAGKAGPRRFVDIVNADTVDRLYTIELINDKAINKHFSGDYAALGQVIFSLGSLYDRWQTHGGDKEGDFYHDATSREITWDGTGVIRLLKVKVKANERFTVGLDFDITTKEDVSIPNFTFHLRQFGTDDFAPEASGGLEGNVTFVISTGEDKETKELSRKAPETHALPTVSDVAVRDWKIYPNPATDAVTIERSESQGTVKIFLYDLSGRLVQESALPDGAFKIIVRTGGLAGGLYLLRLQTADGKTEIRKLTLQSK